MTSLTLLRLVALTSLLAAGPGWADTAVPASGTMAAATASSTIEVPVSTAAPAVATSATAAAGTETSAAPAAGTTSESASAAPAAEAAAQPATAPAAEAPATPAPAAPAYAPTSTTGVSMPVRGMNMENVEHIFGTPLEKQEPVGKPPITRWVYADYVVYFEYNMVLHTVMKSGPFSDSKDPPDGND